MERICFFNSIKFWGGGEKLHLETARKFQKKKYDVVLLANPKSPLWEKAQLEKIITFPMEVGNLSFLNPLKIIKLALFFKRQKIDTVFFSSSQDLKVGSISAKLAGVKNIVYLRGLAVPIKNNLINRFIFEYLLTHIIANSEETKRSILKYLNKHINPNKIATIYHGIDVDQLMYGKNHKLKEINEKGKGVILGNAGRLTHQKGQDKLIKIAKQLKDMHIDFTLFIAGAGEMFSELQLLIDKYNLRKDVILLGYVEDMEGFMNSIDIFLLTSEWEGFGYVLVEAMAKSKPIIAFNISSNPEIVENGKTGFLIDYPDMKMFSEKTVQLIKDESLRTMMGVQGYRMVCKKFRIDDKIFKIESFLLKNDT
jgi:glycosyltransferase involved in cell wall biosynthesis